MKNQHGNIFYAANFLSGTGDMCCCLHIPGQNLTASMEPRVMYSSHSMYDDQVYNFQVLTGHLFTFISQVELLVTPSFFSGHSKKLLSVCRKIP